MPLATKNGLLIVKDDKVAENCNCCGSAAPCGCPPGSLASMRVTFSDFLNRTVPSDVYAQIVSEFEGVTFVLPLLNGGYSDTQSSIGFSGTASELLSMNNDDPVWYGIATCPPSGLAILDVWRKVQTNVIVKWGVRELFFNSCAGGTVNRLDTGASFNLLSNGELDLNSRGQWFYRSICTIGP
jgi:hypothetical protein